MILKTNTKSKGTGQKSSDDKVSGFVIPSKKEIISQKKMFECHLFVDKYLYSAHGVVILVTSPIVKESGKL